MRLLLSLYFILLTTIVFAYDFSININEHWLLNINDNVDYKNINIDDSNW